MTSVTDDVAYNLSFYTSEPGPDNDTVGIDWSNFHRPVVIPYVTVLILEFIIGVPANISLIFLVARVRELRTAPNILLANLAVGDLIFLLVSTPISISNGFPSSPTISFALCKVYLVIYYVSFAVSSLSLTVISLERYAAIVKPFTLRNARESRHTLAVCTLVIWVISILLFGIYPMQIVITHRINVCTVDYHSQKYKVFFLLQMILLYLFPLLCMTVFYALCTHELLRKRRILGQRSTGRASSDRSRMRVAFNLMLITLLFAICWLPNYIYYTWFIFVTNYLSFTTKAFEVVMYMKTVFYYLASCVNPIVLYVMSSSFRHHLIAALTCSEKVAIGQRNGYVARDNPRSVTLKSTIRLREPSTSNSVL